MSPEERALLAADADLAFSVEALRARSPHLCAAPTLTRSAKRALLSFAVVLLALLVVAPWPTLIALNLVAVALYVATLLFRMLLFRRALGEGALVQVSDEDARAVPDAELPVYTILLPAHREPEVIGQLFRALEAIEYPKDRLDVKLLLEADDDATREAVDAHGVPSFVDVVVVPGAGPRTKPKACNYGLRSARGTYVTIYDADDVPDPLQLRRAVVAFTRAAPSVACFQARLAFYNGDQNLITRWFQVEYATWFSHFLPSLVAEGAPLPLGGTSNHFRRDVLEQIGAWDAFNVTEDADLGIRLHRLGYDVAVLDSVTLEEANADFVNWVKQRSRWHKGYLQTWLVHLRSPLRLRRELGPRGFRSFNLFVGGTPVLALVNPVVWSLTVMWFVAEPGWIAALYPAWLYYVALACFVFGNFACVYLNLVTARLANAPELVGPALLAPLYWLMMSIGAAKALLQLCTAPWFWEKTTHGLFRSRTLAEVEQ